MTKLIKTLLFWTLLLCACSLNTPTLQADSASPTTTAPFPQTDNNPTREVSLDFPTTESPNPKIIVTVSTPHIDQGPNGEYPSPTISTPDVPSQTENCGYQWAYQDLPELSAQFDQAIKDLYPKSTSSAHAFGENCIGMEGQVIKFLPMETDFYVILNVSDLSDHEAFGNWIAQVMQVVNSYPPDLLAGPNPGFVEFAFEKSSSESLGFRVPIRQYNETANGKTGEELFRMFHTEP